MLNEDILLELVNEMSIEDIKKMCKTNKKMFEFCKKNKSRIFKDVLYILEYVKFKVGEPEETLEIKTEIYKDKSSAQKKIKEDFDNILKTIDGELSYTDDKNYKKIAQENTSDEDYIYIWRIKTKKVVFV